MLEDILIGDSQVMRSLRADIVRYGASSLPILIEGPSGAGKELVAHALHAISRRAGALVAFNVCAVSDGMFEDALFGHVRGAFTGASHDAAGYLAEANGGTVFLDEISGLGITSQAKLLRALETGVFRPVGAARDRISDFRLVSASNENLSSLVAQRTFRADLWHRIGGCVLQVPSLASRREDIPGLALHFLARVGGETSISERALARLQEHSWEGNVRELRHVMDRAALISGASRIRTRHVAEAVGPKVRTLYTSDRSTEWAGQIATALRENDWDVTSTAAELKMHRATLYRWINKLGIAVPTASRRVGNAGRDEARPSLRISR